MSPGGHLVTTAGACAAFALAGADAPTVAAIFAGGFLIDVDHAIDYVVFEGQRDLRPTTFLQHYLTGAFRRIVLILHSYELLAALSAVAWWTGNRILSGYLVGALLHLALDVLFNGEQTPRSISAFYSFVYRARHRFDAAMLFGGHIRTPVPHEFWRAFFDVREIWRALMALLRVAPREAVPRARRRNEAIANSAVDVSP